MAANMQDYLDQVLLIAPQGKREKFATAGVTTLQALVRKPDTFAHQAAQTIRKSSTGHAQARDVSLEEETRIGQLVYFCKLRYLLQRPLAFGAATLDNIEAVAVWFEQLEEDPDEGSVAVFSDSCNKKQWFESITAYFGLKKGKSSGVPLLYVIREVAALPQDADDPGYGRYNTFNDELIRRGRHDGHFWRPDNAEVWTFLRGKCHGTTAWPTIVAFQPTKNGRGAFLALLGQFLGADAKSLLLKKAETTLEKITFDGRSRNWTFDKFIGRLRESFIDLGTGNQLSEERKVNKLMQAWHVSSLSHLNAFVTSNPTYKYDFNACVNYLSEQLTHQQLMNKAPGRNVAALSQDSMDCDDQIDSNNRQIAQLKSQIKSLNKKLERKKGGGKSPSKTPIEKNKSPKFDPSNPGAYIPRPQWEKLSEEERAQARAAREKKGIKTRKLSCLMSGKKKKRAQLKDDGEDAMDVDEDKMDVEVETLAGEVQDLTLSAVGTRARARGVDPSLLQSPSGPGVARLGSATVSPPANPSSNLSVLRTSQREATYARKKAPPSSDPSKQLKKPPPGL